VPLAITSRRHPLVVACREARSGGDDQPLLLDGWHLLVEAVQSAADVDAVLVATAPPGPAERAALDALADRGAQIAHATADVLQAASPVRTPTGIVALARRPVRSLDRVFAAAPALVAAALDVQDPGNVGAIVRTAEAAGASGVVAVGASADPFGWKALRASMGSAFRVPTARLGDAAQLVAEVRRRQLRLVVLGPSGGVRPEAVDLRGPVCLVLGGEGQGVPADILSAADARLRLPMHPPVQSLNVAVAGALALYAAAAQREAGA
jgi:TrmH family RNA methyltransferase